MLAARFRRTLFAIVAAAALVGSARPRAIEPPVTASLDRLASAAFPAPDKPGAAVIVVKDGVPILRKGYGLANLELSVPNAPDMVFEIGSLTKQFTAAAILKLVEDGRISLADDFRKYLHDPLPMGQWVDHKYSIDSLLTHTSGIANYTDLPAWKATSRADLSRADLIDLFAGKTDFDPGTNWAYNNSGYVLLGAVIEDVSGQSFAEFLDQRIFRPLHMTHTCYGDPGRVIVNRASGYEMDHGRYANAGYISMKQPFAAGALMSTVDDLAIWNAALDGASVLTEASKAKMWSSFKLGDGRDTGYGYGWAVGMRDGAPVQQHGGAINGFLSHVVRLPRDQVYVAVLSNDASRGAAIGRLAEALASAAAGRPLVNPPVVAGQAPSGDLAGVYDGPFFNERVTIGVKDGAYVIDRGEDTAPLVPMGRDAFFVRDEFVRLTFDRDAHGTLVDMIVHGFANDETYVRANK